MYKNYFTHIMRSMTICYKTMSCYIFHFVILFFFLDHGSDYFQYCDQSIITIYMRMFVEFEKKTIHIPKKSLFTYLKTSFKKIII